MLKFPIATIPHFLVTLSPYLIGSLYIPPPVGSEFLAGYYISALILLSCAPVWALLRSKVRDDQITKRMAVERLEKSRLGTTIEFAKLAVPALLILLVLKNFSERFEVQAFYGLLAAFAASAIADALAIRKLFGGALFALLAYHTGIGLLSFQPAIIEISLPVVVVALAHAAIVSAYELSFLEKITAKAGSLPSAVRSMHKSAVGSPDTPSPRDSTRYALLAAAGPMLISSLVYAGLLRNSYLVCLVPLCVLLQLSPNSGLQRERILRSAALLQIVTIIMAGLL